MSVNENLYAIQGNYGELSFTYPFNSTSFPEYRQPYNTPIDSSIWFILRQPGEYGLGNYYTEWYTTENGANLHVHEYQNGFSINPSCPVYSSSDGKWAPFVISSTANAQFYRTFDYSKLVMLPSFDYITPDNTSLRSGYYDEIPENAMITTIQLNPHYGNTGSRSNLSNFRLNYMQIAYGYYPTTNYGRAGDFVSGTFYKSAHYYNDYLLDQPRGYMMYHAKTANQYVIEKTEQYYPLSIFSEFILETDSYDYYYYYVTKEQAHKMVSAMGYYWATNGISVHSATGENCTDDGVILPLINPENNTVTDQTIRGQEISDDAIANPDSNSNWKSDIDKIRENTPQDSTQETDEILLNEPKLGAVGAFNQYYVMNKDDVNGLAGWLWNADVDLYEAIVRGLALMGNNPINGIISLRMYPFEIGNFFEKEYKEIYFGRYNSGILGQRIKNSYITLNLGTATFRPSEQNFIAYEPYTKAWLYIPYCGIVSVSPSEFVNKTISVKMVVDVTTGNCTAIVYSSGIPVLYKDGVIGVSIPITGINQSEWANNFVNGAVMGAGTALVAGALTGGVGSLAIGGAVASSAFKVTQSLGASIEKQGSSSPMANMVLPQNCYLIFESVETNVPENYGQTVGFMCMKSDLLSTFTGFSIFGNVDVSNISGATETELTELKDLLESGVYL